jgi:hypothetical protein
MDPRDSEGAEPDKNERLCDEVGEKPGSVKLGHAVGNPGAVVVEGADAFIDFLTMFGPKRLSQIAHGTPAQDWQRWGPGSLIIGECDCANKVRKFDFVLIESRVGRCFQVASLAVNNARVYQSASVQSVEGKR